MKMKLEKGLEPGKYTGTLVRFEEIESKFGPALKFIYETDDDQEASELINMKYSTKSKLGKRVQELLGELPEDLDLSLLIGKRVELTLIEQDESDFCKVQKVKKEDGPVEVVEGDCPL